jgi:hypothetical protein
VCKHGFVSRLPLVVTLTLLATSVGCGGSSSTDGNSSATRAISWKSVVNCFDSKAISYTALDHAGDPEGAFLNGSVEQYYSNGSYYTYGEDSEIDTPPFSFSDAPNGWIVADLGQAQRAFLMFYGTPLEASRLFDEGAGAAFKGARAAGNVLLGYDADPTSAEKDSVEKCVQ